MPAKRRRFSRQFKAGAVQLVVEHDRPIAEVARELQLNETTLGNWVKAWRAEHPEPEPEQSPWSVPAWLRWKTSFVGSGWKTSS